VIFPILGYNLLISMRPVMGDAGPWAAGTAEPVRSCLPVLTLINVDAINEYDSEDNISLLIQYLGAATAAESSR
jgi:hypothetical protein